MNENPTGMNKLNVLLAEDETLVREGMRALLEKEPFIRNIYEASTGQEAIDLMGSYKIDLVLLDIRMPGLGGAEVVQQLRQRNDSLKIIIVTGLDGIELIINLLRMGVNGIVYKLHGFGEILKAILSVIERGSYFPEQVLQTIRQNAERWENVPPVSLSEKDRLLLGAIVEGLTTKQMATKLHMSERTAETYRQRLIKKVGMQNTAGLIAYAFRNGII